MKVFDKAWDVVSNRLVMVKSTDERHYLGIFSEDGQFQAGATLTRVVKCIAIRTWALGRPESGRGSSWSVPAPVGVDNVPMMRPTGISPRRLDAHGGLESGLDLVGPSCRC